jgi:hypothetical protein
MTIAIRKINNYSLSSSSKSITLEDMASEYEITYANQIICNRLNATFNNDEKKLFNASTNTPISFDNIELMPAN